MSFFRHILQWRLRSWCWCSIKHV